MDVTQAWMLGVVAMMLAFGSVALFGYVRVRRHRRSQDSDDVQ